MAATHLLDTSIYIYIRRARPPVVEARFARTAAGSLAMSVITWGELLYGACRSVDPVAARVKLDLIAERIPVLALSSQVVDRYAATRAWLAERGDLIGSNDLWIAAHALAEDLILVMNNVREFKRVPGLRVENWT